MRIAITGARGFFGRHLQVRLLAAGRHQVIDVSREVFVDTSSLAEAVADVDAVVHLAGVNRGKSDVVETQNQVVAEQLVAALDRAGATPPVFYANSIHAGTDTPYGRGKRGAAEILQSWAARSGGQVVDVVYHNLFGEGGRPDYNSFVATFCDRLARGERPEILIDRPLELIHAQAAAQTLVDLLNGLPFLESTTIATHGVATTVAEVLDRLTGIAGLYRQGTFPDLSDLFTRQLFNTYRSFQFPSLYPFPLTPKSDIRGTFVESVRCAGGQSQASYSTTTPGVTRGNHFHLGKVERFLVLKGEARISIRPVCGTEVHHFDVSGDRPAIVDIPTLHTHNITNVGDEDLYTLFWADEMYDPSDPDTFVEPVT